MAHKVTLDIENGTAARTPLDAQEEEVRAEHEAAYREHLAAEERRHALLARLRPDADLAAKVAAHDEPLSDNERDRLLRWLAASALGDTLEV